jgi:mono/diheme cytochrome c family protein
MKSFFLFILIFFFVFQSSKSKIQDTWVAPESAKELSNPISAKKQKLSAKNGEKVFNKRCIFCHGAKGKGDGAAGARLNPKPANLTSSRVQNQQDGEIFWKISNGRGNMPTWEPIISETDRWNLVNFIRTLDLE